MKPIYLRLITFFVGMPAIVVLVVLLPQAGHLALNVLLVAVTVAGALEISSLLEKKGIPTDKYLAVACSALFPIGVYLEIVGVIAADTTLIVMLIGIHAVLARQLFGIRKSGTQGVLMRTGADLLLLVYPGFLMAFVVRVLSLPEPTIAFLIFVIIVFVNDTGAYVFGMLLGRSNTGIFPLSPAKSLAGLIAGVLLSMVAAFIFFRFFPGLFGGSIFFSLFAGFCISVVAVTGDLVESAFKRSAGTKDSGHIIPGRGGILDSIDSVVFCGPAFYLLMKYLVDVF